MTERIRVDLLSLSSAALGTLTRGQVDVSLTGSIDADIRHGGKLAWVGLLSEMPDWRQILVRPVYVREGDGEYPLGTYLCRAPSRVEAPTGVKVDVQLYDRALIASETRLQKPLAYPIGTRPVDTVVARLAALGEAAVDAVASASTLKAALSWDAGTTELKVANDLLGAAGYWSLHVNAYGRWQVQPYVLPAARPVAYTFAPGEAAIHLPEWTVTRDDWQVPNRLTGWQRVDGSATPLTSTQVLPDSSPYSRRSLRRWVDAEPLRGVEATSQAALDTATMRELLSRSAIATQVDMTHAWTPGVDVGSVVRFPRVGPGRWTVSSWTADLGPGLLVKAKLREVAV